MMKIAELEELEKEKKLKRKSVLCKKIRILISFILGI